MACGLLWSGYGKVGGASGPRPFQGVSEDLRGLSVCGEGFDDGWAVARIFFVEFEAVFVEIDIDIKLGVVGAVLGFDEHFEAGGGAFEGGWVAFEGDGGEGEGGDHGLGMKVGFVDFVDSGDERVTWSAGGVNGGGARAHGE